LSFSNLERNDFDNRFDIQEVTTGAFIMVPKDKRHLRKIELDKSKAEKWLNDHCKTLIRHYTFFCLEDAKLSRVECYASKIKLIETATGGASSCLQAFF
jgi:trans-2,3-dihydro-3-hydroxyanthranilate isomerase